MSLLNPDHLLDQSDRLTDPLGAGAPRQADLRRAVSSAYYALFHAIATEAADTLVGRNRRATSIYALVYRSVEHKSLKAICGEIVKANIRDKYKLYQPKGGFGAELNDFATAVSDLQEKRHAADYDPLYRMGRSDAVLAVKAARTALARFRGASANRRRVFVSLVVFSPRT